MSFLDKDDGENMMTVFFGKYGHVWVAIVASVIAICIAAYKIVQIIWG